MEDIDKFEIPEKIRKKLEDLPQLKKELGMGKTGQDILEISDELMSKFYQAAQKLFEHEKHIDAADAFLFLVTLNPHVYEYWLGLGMTLQLLGQTEEAVDAYEMAALCKASDPVPYFYLAKCLFELHERDTTLQALELAIEYADDLPQYKELKREAKEAKRLLKKGDRPKKK